MLEPGGKLVFIEHVRSEEPRLAGWQDRLNLLNRFVACCDCNRDTLAAIEAEGFEVADSSGRSCRRRHRSSGR